MTTIRPMTEHDLALGMRLKDAAGWNQTEADWRRFLRLGLDEIFVAEVDGAGVGTVATFTFGDVAWIAMMLVDPAHRCRGIGTALMQHALKHLDRGGVGTIRLDATAMGRSLYEQFGFVAEYELARYEGVPPSLPATVGVVSLGNAALLAEAAALDRRVTATDRGCLLQLLHDERPDAMLGFVRGGRLVGYVANRPGSNAAQIGPCIAEDAEAGTALLHAAAARWPGQRVFVDIPLPNRPAITWAESVSLKLQRNFIRMCRGRRLTEDPARIWASSGPETG